MAVSWTNSVNVMTTDDGPSSLKSANSETKRKGFHPLRAVRKIFRRKSKQSTKHDERVDPSSMVSLKSRSTSELLGADDEDRNRPSNGSNNLGSGLSMSHDSVFSPEHNNDDDIRNAQSIQNLAMQELMDRLHPPHDSDDDDAGLPHSPCTSPTTAEVLRQGLREASGKSRSTCSDGSLLSMGSSENDEDSLMQSSRQLKMPSDRHDVDSEDGAAFPLSHKAAHHKISVRPKRTHAVGRHRKLQQQLTVASLPATPEDIEEMRGVSPDRSWHSVGEREAAGSSGSASRASSVMSTSDSTGSLSASASPTRKKVLPTPQDLDGSIRPRSSGADWKLAKQDEALGRRRTFSESPHREMETRERETVEAEARRDKVQSLSMLEGKEMHATVTSWGQQEAKRDSRNASPSRKDFCASPQQGSPVRRAQSSLSTREDEGLMRAASPIRVMSKSPVLIQSTSPDLKIAQNTISQSATSASTPQNARTSDVEVAEGAISDARRSIKRDPSYRVAVQESPRLNEFNDNVIDKNKKVESSGGKFGFGSKTKKTADVPLKETGKEKKEEKPKKEEKKVDDSPFFSRFWGSRKSNKKKKDKKDEEAESDSTAGFDSEEKESSTEIRRQSDFPTTGSVDVKAMIQNITARSSFSGTYNSRSKEQEFQDGKPARPIKPKSMCAGSASKSMESLGPKSLDTVVSVDLDSNPPQRTHLSGSMPRLDSSPLKVKQIKIDEKDDAAENGVMMIEGEIVRLRKKVFAGEDPKLKSTPDQTTPASADQKRNSKRSSILSWYNNKKESNAVEKPIEKVETPVPSTTTASRSSNSFSGRLWSSKKEETKSAVNGKSPQSSVRNSKESTPKVDVVQNVSKHEKKDSASKVTDVKPETPAKKIVEPPRKSSGKMTEVEMNSRTSTPDKAQRPETIRLQSVYKTPETVGKLAHVDVGSKKRPTTVSQVPVASVDKHFPQVEAKNVDVIVKPQMGTNDDISSLIVNLDSSPRSSIQKCNEKKENKQEMLDKGEANQNGETSSKFVRGSVSKEGTANGESELMKVFHRRSLKVKDKEPTVQTVSVSDVDKEESKQESQEPVSSPVSMTSQNSDESSPIEKSSKRSGMANKKSKSLCLETAPAISRTRTTSSPSTSVVAVDITAKNGEKNEDESMPEWRRIAQKRREQREQREKQHVTGNGHADPAMLLQATPKHSGRSKVLDMVSNFQKLQVS